MKKTRLLVLLRSIWSTKVSFFSIMLFVGLGVGIFLGIRWNQPAFQNTTESYYEKYKFHDFEVSYPYGITEEDIEAIREIPEVTQAEGGYTAEGTVEAGERRQVVVIQSLTETLDNAMVRKGKLPQAANEVAIERKLAKEAKIAVGDEISIQSERGGNNSLTGEKFKVTAVVDHPTYIHKQSSSVRGTTNVGEGSIYYYILLPGAAFNKTAYDDCYSNVYLSCDSLRGKNSFEEDYLTQAGQIADELSELGGTRGLARYESVQARYQKEIDDGEKQIADGEKQIKDNEKKIADGEKEVAAGEKQVASGAKQIAAGEKKVAAGEKQVASGKKAVAAGEKTYKEKKKEAAAAEKKIKKGEKQLKKAKELYKKAQSEYEKGEKQLKEALASFQEKRQEWQAEFENGKKEYENLEPAAKKEIVNKWLEKNGLSRDTEISDDPATAKGQIEQLIGAVVQAKGDVDGLEDSLEKIDSEISAADVKSDLERLEATLRDAAKKISEYLDGESTLKNLKAELEKAAAKIKDGEAELKKGKKELAKGKKELAAGKKKLDSGKAKLASGMKELDDGKSLLKKKKTELEEGKKELAEGKKELEDGKKELEDGKKELEESKAELEEGKQRLSEAKGNFAKLTKVDSWILQKRSDNISYNVAKVYSETGSKLCYSLALLFVFVGVMICYTSISRIVMEDQVMTGVEKALGFTKSEIVLHYMEYAVLTVICGGALGGAIGYFVVERIVNDTLSTLFVFGEFIGYFSLRDLLVISAVELVLICLSAWIACYRQLSRKAIELLKGEKKTERKAHFYERFGWWKKLSLYTQMTVNNLVNDRTRVIATLVGVVGCTSLIVMALTVDAALENTPVRHFSNVTLYDARVVSDDGVKGAMENLAAALDAEDAEYTAVYQKSYYIQDDEGMLHGTDVVVAPDPEKLSPFFRLNDVSGGGELQPPEEGVLLSEVYTKFHDVGVGDTIKLLDRSGKTHEIPVAGVIEHYLTTNQIFMSPSYFESVMGSEPEENTYYVNLKSGNAEELKEKISGTEGYLSMTDDHAKWVKLFRSYQKTTALIVAIAFLMAAVMALLVLLNLNVVLIQERSRELIVMRINGFSIAETKRYIYRDNIALTALGVLLGVCVGMALTVFVINSVSNENAYIMTAQDPWACLKAVALTAFFTLITNLIALRRVEKLKASDLNKM